VITRGSRTSPTLIPNRAVRAPRSAEGRDGHSSSRPRKDERARARANGRDGTEDTVREKRAATRRTAEKNRAFTRRIEKRVAARLALAATSFEI